MTEVKVSLSLSLSLSGASKVIFRARTCKLRYGRSSSTQVLSSVFDQAKFNSSLIEMESTLESAVGH